MQFLKALVVISSIAHAMSTSPDSVERFNLIHQRNKVNSRVSTTAWSWDWSVMLAHSCSSSLLSWPFEQLPVHFDVDENGVGLVLLGPTSHTLQGLNRSEHVHCSGMYGKEESAIMCAIAAPLTTAIIHPSAELTALDCGSEDPLGLASLVRRLSIPHSTNRGQSISRENRKAMFAGSAQEATLSKQRRQGACGAWSKHTAKFEDGHPHQLPLHKQLSENLDCRDGSCSAEYLRVESFTIGFSATASAYSWIDAGFAVEKSIETGTSNSCAAKEGERVCVWKKVDRTTYSVQNMDLNQCTGSQPSGAPFTMVSLNKKQPGMNFYCVRNNFCREIGAQYEEEAVPGVP